MKKLFVIATCVFIVLNSCKKDTSFSGVSDQGNEASKQVKMERNKIMNSQTLAQVTDQHIDFPGPFDLINECSGETVTVTGTIGIDIHIVINGNKMNYIEQQHGHLIGTGSLGNTYVTNLNENITLNGLTSNNGVFVINDVTIFRMTSNSGANNFKFRRNAHLTINANGVVTVDRVDNEVICQK